MLIFLFLIGISFGSFLNVVADRLVEGKTLGGRSACDYCHKTLRWFELIPLLSFAASRGTCLRCHKKLSWSYPFSELISGLLFILVGLNASSYLFLVLYLGIVSCLIGILLADVKYRIIPDEILIVLGVISLFFVLKNPLDHIFGAALVGSLLYILYEVTHRKGLGFGDVKFGLVMGFLLGVQSGILALYLSFLIGGVVGIILIVLERKKFKSKIAFGPFMVAGILIMILFSPYVLQIIHRFIPF